MPLEGEYVPSTIDWVREQVDRYERSGGTEGTTLHDTGLPVVVVTMRGRRSGGLRKVPLMRVEDGGRYLLVASKRASVTDPVWVHNLRHDPDVTVQDGPQVHEMTARELAGDERSRWWDVAVDRFDRYAEYQAAVERVIPLFLCEPRAARGDAPAP